MGLSEAATAELRALLPEVRDGVTIDVPKGWRVDTDVLAFGIVVARALTGALTSPGGLDVVACGRVSLPGGAHRTPVRGMFATACLAKDASMPLVVPEAFDDRLIAGSGCVFMRYPSWETEPAPTWTIDRSDVVDQCADGVLSPDLRAQFVEDRQDLCLIGPPGSGKTMRARRLALSLPPLSEEELRECRCRYSSAGIDLSSFVTRPFRAPHHTVSELGLLGELELARCGTLFLDEVSEFRWNALAALAHELGHNIRDRKPIPRLILASNACACGWAGSPKACSCTHQSRELWTRRLEKIARLFNDVGAPLAAPCP